MTTSTIDNYAQHAGGFNSREKAQRWLDFMNGRRYAK